MSLRVSKELLARVLMLRIGAFQCLSQMLIAPPRALEELHVNRSPMLVDFPEPLTVRAAHSHILLCIYHQWDSEVVGSWRPFCGVTALQLRLPRVSGGSRPSPFIRVPPTPNSAPKRLPHAPVARVSRYHLAPQYVRGGKL
jgi:hypothetical protein